MAHDLLLWCLPTKARDTMTAEWTDLSDDELRVRLERKLYGDDPVARSSWMEQLIRNRDDRSYFDICEILEDDE